MKIFLLFLCLVIVSSFVLKKGAEDKEPEVSLNDSILNIYLIPHTHDDVGWLKTPDNYFYGDDQKTQWAGVRYTLDSVITELTLNENLKFSVVQIAFLDMWWRGANQTMRDQMAQHVKNGKLEFLNAGWCMSDEATTYYQDIIDQMTIGMRWVNEKFGVVPTVAWQLDPFGHQASFATLGHQFGFNSIFFARVHHEDKDARENSKGMELLWKPPQVSGNVDSLFTHINFYMYNSPAGFCFDEVCRDEPIKSDPTLEGYNLDVKAAAFVDYFRNMSKSYKSNNLLHTLGSDFQWSNARMWTLNMDKLIAYVQSKPEFGINVRYATPSQYIKAVNAQGLTYPTKTDDFFPYADYKDAYWSGYFTSRVAIKGFVRDAGRWLQSLRTKLALLRISNTSSYVNSHGNQSETAILEMQKQMGILQHHDAVSGTEKQKVANQYISVASKAKAKLIQFYNNIINEQTKDIVGESADQIFQTHWNQTYAEWGISKSLAANKNVLLHLYNPGPYNQYPIRIKVQSRNLSIVASDNSTIKGNIICGNTKDTSDCQLFFTLKIAETSWGFVKLLPSSSAGSVSIVPISELSVISPSKSINLSSSASVEIHRTNEKFTLTLPSGTHSFSFAYNYYECFQDVGQKSGAYIFRPSAATKNSPKKYSSLKSLHYSDGSQVLVISMVEDKTYTKLYFSKISGYVEAYGVEIQTFIDSIDVSDKQGKEIVLDITTGLANNNTFYTDSNGLEEQKRILNYVPTWNITVDQPVAANYYPINSHIKINDSSKTVSVIVDRSRGGSVLNPGVIELMLHRRTLADDVRGVGEALNETDSAGKGLNQTVRNYLLFGSTNRELQKRLDQPIQVTWSNSNSASFAQNLPKNVTLPVPKETKLWLRGMPDNTYILRAQYLDTTNTSGKVSVVSVPVGWNIVELTLGANQLLSDWKEKDLQWKGTSLLEQTTLEQSHSAPKKFKKLSSAPVSQIELKALEIRTFKLSK